MSQETARFIAPVVYHGKYLAYIASNGDSFTWMKNLVIMATIYGLGPVSYYKLERTSNGTMD